MARRRTARPTIVRKPATKPAPKKPGAWAAVCSLKRLRLGDLVRLLAGAGCRNVSELTVRADIAAGAPVNRDGTVNFLSFVAWICQEGGA